MAGPAKRSLSARIVVVGPPTGAWFALQTGHGSKGRPVKALLADGADLVFEFEISVVVDGGTVQCSGDFVQGPKGGRFVYINSGTLAGHPASLWTRRAKIEIESLSVTLIERALASGGAIEARFNGRSRDGGPACATVPLLAGGWSLTTATSGKRPTR